MMAKRESVTHRATQPGPNEPDTPQPTPREDEPTPELPQPIQLPRPEIPEPPRD
jgi:hypothetical protein